MARHIPAPRRTKVGASGDLCYNASAPSVCALCQHRRVSLGFANPEIVARSVGENVLFGSSRLQHRLTARCTAPPRGGTGCGRSRRGHPHLPPRRDLWVRRRGLQREDHVSTRTLSGAGRVRRERGARSFHDARTIGRAEFISCCDISREVEGDPLPRTRATKPEVTEGFLEESGARRRSRSRDQ